jgi:crossover junction endodeoxyribonuclease RuvC
VIYIGIDPGKSGAVAIITSHGESVFDLTDSHADNVQLLNELRRDCELERCAAVVVIEQVSAMPKQGVTSSFNFGKTFGVLIGALIALGFQYQTVTPAKWKAKVFDSSPRGTGKAAQKTAARDLARRLYPAVSDQLKRVKDADRAEALLMAHYAKITAGVR